MNQKKQLAILIIIIFLGFLGVSIPFPILAPLFLHPHHTSLVSAQWPRSTRSILLGLTLAMYPLGQFLGSPVLGSLSDQYGRKKVLLLSMASTGIGYIITALSIHFALISLLLLSRLFTGFVEGNIAIAQASISDLDINKHKGFGAITTVVSMGYIVGPLIGGFFSNPQIVSWFNYSLPFYIASGIALLTTIGIYFFFRETAQQHRAVTGSILSEFNIYKKIRHVSKNIDLKWLLISGVFLYLAIDTYYEFFPALLVGRWHTTSMGIAFYNIGLAIGLSLGSFWLASYLSRKFNPRLAICCSIGFFISTYILLLLTQNINYIFVEFTLIGLTYGTAATMHTVLFSDNAHKNHQGEVLGLRWGLRMLGDAIICVIGGFLIMYSVSLPIIIAAISAFISLLIFIKYYRSYNQS